MTNFTLKYNTKTSIQGLSVQMTVSTLLTQFLHKGYFSTWRLCKSVQPSALVLNVDQGTASIVSPGQMTLQGLVCARPAQALELKLREMQAGEILHHESLFNDPNNQRMSIVTPMLIFM